MPRREHSLTQQTSLLDSRRAHCSALAPWIFPSSSPAPGLSYSPSSTESDSCAAIAVSIPRVAAGIHWLQGLENLSESLCGWFQACFQGGCGAGNRIPWALSGAPIPKQAERCFRGFLPRGERRNRPLGSRLRPQRSVAASTHARSLPTISDAVFWHQAHRPDLIPAQHGFGPAASGKALSLLQAASRAAHCFPSSASARFRVPGQHLQHQRHTDPPPADVCKDFAPRRAALNSEFKSCGDGASPSNQSLSAAIQRLAEPPTSQARNSPRPNMASSRSALALKLPKFSLRRATKTSDPHKSIVEAARKSISSPFQRSKNFAPPPFLDSKNRRRSANFRALRVGPPSMFEAFLASLILASKFDTAPNRQPHFQRQLASSGRLRSLQPRVTASRRSSSWDSLNERRAEAPMSARVLALLCATYRNPDLTCTHAPADSALRRAVSARCAINTI
uniref:Uncharacterized protein n=1 Tax=Mycena chlorophos TaxID=658473 RepID=A0ABQ0KUQ7_MYCCL|nr:predicted protein [Mycena chlorophos]